MAEDSYGISSRSVSRWLEAWLQFIISATCSVFVRVIVHKSFDELRLDIATARELIVEGATYSHYKDPDSRYTVEGLGIDEETDEVTVIYFSNEAPDVSFVSRAKKWLTPAGDKDRYSIVRE